MGNLSSIREVLQYQIVLEENIKKSLILQQERERERETERERERDRETRERDKRETDYCNL